LWWRSSLHCLYGRYPAHEEEIGRLAVEMGFTHVSLSSSTMPMIKIVPRGFTGQRYIRNVFHLLLMFFHVLKWFPRNPESYYGH